MKRRSTTIKLRYCKTNILVLCALTRVLAAQPSDSVQPPDTVATSGAELARFEEARALAMDPAGFLYVADGGGRLVVQLDVSGQVLKTVGGTGSGDGEFDEPADVDPTNGLIWIVADAGSGWIHRFSRASVFLESIPVGPLPGNSPSRTFGVGQAMQSGAPEGRPVAVASSPTREMFALDAARNLVLKWDAARRLERTIGAFEAGDGALVEPVGLAVSETSVYVADRGGAAIKVFDLFGSYEGTLLAGRAEDVRAVSLSDGFLWVVLPYSVLQLDAGGELVKVVDVDVGEPLVDALGRGEDLYVLTSTRLLHVPL